MSRIATNTAANTAYRNLSATNGSFQKSIEKLSSGFRINRSSDDAAGLSIANRLRQDNRSLQQASRNASQAGSVLQIADGAVSTITDVLGRMKELSVQASSDNVTDNDRVKLNAEYQQLFAEIDRTVDNTKYQGSKLLDGNYGVRVDTDAADSDAFGVAGFANVELSGAGASETFTIQNDGTTVTLSKGSGAGAVSQTVAQTGGSAGETQTFNFDKLGVKFSFTGTMAADALKDKVIKTEATTGGSFQVGSDANADSQIGITLGNLKTGTTTTGLKLAATDLLNSTNAKSSMTKLDSALGLANEAIGSIGAAQSRLEFAQANLSSRIQNGAAAESVIRDADMAFEMTQFTKNQVLQQAGQSMLAQANQSAQGVLSLLRG